MIVSFAEIKSPDKIFRIVRRVRATIAISALANFEAFASLYFSILANRALINY